MAKKCYIHLVFFPKLLQAFPSQELFMVSQGIVEIRRIAKDAMSCKNQPWLFPSVSRCKAFLNELVLFCSLPPVIFTVCYAKVEHSIVCRIPRCSKKCHNQSFNLALDMLGFKENLGINNPSTRKKLLSAM